MTENKRFLIDDAGELIDLENHKFIDYGYECCKLLNELAEENEQLKQQIKDLYKFVKYDVDNEIDVYPKSILEHLENILKIIGDV